MAIVVVGADCMYKRCYLKMMGDMARQGKNTKNLLFCAQIAIFAENCAIWQEFKMNQPKSSSHAC